jgi:type I restriction enzyme R subunit
LFAGELTEVDFVGYVKTMESKLLENEELAHQAGSNSEEQFMLGDFKEIFSNTIIDSLDAQNSIAKQLLSDERIFAAMQGMMATAVYKAFKAQRPSM